MKIEFKNTSFTYAEKTPFANIAFSGIDWKVKNNKITTIIGRTGCGKTSVVKHINGLILPTEGEVIVGDFKLERKKIKVLKKGKYKRTRKVKLLRSKIGYVSQLPEYQLFEDTIYKDLIFGPKNFNMNIGDLREQAIKVLKMVGLSEEYLERSPLDLSGGQKRRVALAGVLIMQSDVMILDEPTAGLDPEGEESIKQIILNLNKKMGKTIIIISHDMNLANELSDEIVLMSEGKITQVGKPIDIFSTSLNEELHIVEPDVVRIQKKVFDNVSVNTRTVEELANLIEDRISA